MRRTLFIFLLIIASGACLYAQEAPPFGAIKFEKQEDYHTSEPIVLQTADHLLSTPIKPNDIDRLKEVQFLRRWMEGTDAHTFMISDYPVKFFINDLDLMGIYMAALCKAGLESKPADVNQLTLNATQIFLKYINESSHKAKLTKDLKRLSAANDKGELKSYLRM